MKAVGRRCVHIVVRGGLIINLLFLCALPVAASRYDTWIAPDPRTQLIEEGLDDHMGRGRLFVPVMSRTNWEPRYSIFTLEHKETKNLEMGKSVFLEPGKYQVVLGSAKREEDKIRHFIEIKEQETLILEPDWGALLVKIINESREGIRLGYEIFPHNSDQSIGVQYSKAESEYDVERSTWILKPGKYKLVKQGEPHNTIFNFVTFELRKSELKQITIVVDSQTLQFRGGGELEETKFTARTRGNWRNFLYLRGSFSFGGNNQLGQDQPDTSISFQGKLDNTLRFDKKPYYLNLKQKLYIEFTKHQDTDFRVSQDEFALNNTGIYYFTDVFGIYAELDLGNKLFPGDVFFEGEKTVEKVRLDGSTTIMSNQASLRVSPSLFPLTLQEELGFNFSLLRRPNSKFYIRTGLGFVQNYNQDVYTKTSENGTIVFQEQGNNFTTGYVLSLEGDFQFSDLILNSDASFLYSLNKQQNQFEFRWENSLTLRVLKYISIELSLTFNYQDEKKYLVYSHQLALSFSYFFSQ